jgi:DNA-directed RNA polymerase beta subunit
VPDVILSADILGMINVFIVQMKKDDSIVCLTNQFSEIPLFVLMRALGVSSDYDIIKYIVYDINDYDMANMLRYSLDKSLSEVKDIKGVNKIVRTLPTIIHNKEDALLIINTFKDKLTELEVLPLLERKFFKPPPSFAMCDDIVCQYKDGKWRDAVIYAIRHEMIYIHFKQISLKENMAISVYDPRLYPEPNVEIEPIIPTGWYCYCDMNMHLNEFNIEKCNNCGANCEIFTE